MNDLLTAPPETVPEHDRPKRPLTVSEVARLKGVSAATIRRWEREGKIVARRTAAGWRIFEE